MTGTASFVEQFGGIGDGPLELRGATTFHLFPDGRIAVPLGEWGPIKIFERSEAGWEMVEMIDSVRAQSLCGMSDDRWYSASYAKARGTTIINEIGDNVQSFGSGYQHDEWYLRRALSGGSVACLTKFDRIVYGFEILPIVKAYGTDGSLEWTAALGEGHLQLQVMEVRHPENGRLGYSESASRDHDRLLGVHVVGDGDHILLAYARVLPGQREIVPQYYLLDATTGGGAYLGDESLPAILSVQRNGYISLGTGRGAAIYIEVWRNSLGEQ